MGDSSDDDETNKLVLSDSEPNSSGAKKYVVSDGGGGGLKGKRFTRNEWICVVVGVVTVVMGLMVVLGIGVGAALGSSQSSGSNDRPWKNIRLPSAITPEGLSLSYSLSLTLPLSLSAALVQTHTHTLLFPLSPLCIHSCGIPIIYHQTLRPHKTVVCIIVCVMYNCLQQYSLGLEFRRHACI